MTLYDDFLCLCTEETKVWEKICEILMQEISGQKAPTMFNVQLVTNKSLAV